VPCVALTNERTKEKIMAGIGIIAVALMLFVTVTRDEQT
jgi:hypothetical protein